jgi:hypothetical protein
MHILAIIFFAPLALMLGLAFARNIGLILLMIFFAALLLISVHQSPTLPQSTIRLNHDERPVEPRTTIDDNTHHYTPNETVSGHPPLNH